MRSTSRFAHKLALFTLVLLPAVFCISLPAVAASYKMTVLTADQTGQGKFLDTNLQNPWGISLSPTGPFWVSDNQNGLSTLYDGTGTPQTLIVTIPPAAGNTTGTPTGTVFNSTTDFKIGGTPSIFLFVTEDGTISGWTGGSSAILAADHSAAKANYKGMELANNGTANFLYVANFFAGTVDVFDANFQPATLSGNFHDPNLPAGYAPFNVRNIKGTIYVTYAKQNATKTDATFCAGCGFVDTFDLNGKFKKRLVTQGKLNAPWGIAIAPANFGTFSKDILVGNLGDGKISAYNPTTGAFLGQLTNSAGKPIVIQGLWALVFGTSGEAGKANQLFFTSGPGGYVHGHFGMITAQ